MNEYVNCSTINQTIHQLINQSINKAIKHQSNNQPVHQQSINESINQYRFVWGRSLVSFLSAQAHLILHNAQCWQRFDMSSNTENHL